MLTYEKTLLTSKDQICWGKS